MKTKKKKELSTYHVFNNVNLNDKKIYHRKEDLITQKCVENCLVSQEKKNKAVKQYFLESIKE